MPDTELILDAIGALRDDVKDLAERQDKRSDALDERLQSAEKSILRFKTLGSAIASLAAFFGWDSVKHHLPTLLR